MTPPISAPIDRKSVDFVHQLSGFGDRVAVMTDDEVLSYAELAKRVGSAARELGSQRRLIAQAATNTIDSLVWYLAALQSGNPIILVPSDSPSSFNGVVEGYDPDVVIDSTGRLHSHRDVSNHELNPELALLLSTSGSTGSPKLVRLSHRNLDANAHSIADYLQIRDTDRAATSLPMGYCYGLSVINSHLSRGAGIVLTELSVVDECFWTLFRRAGATTFAGVPYTFDLLDRIGFADMDLPRLRYVTQAGGRLAPVRVRSLAQLGQRSGWDFFVMYGQTEATARMAYLPPDLAVDSPAAIGVPIPGGEFRLVPVDEAEAPEVGELVYTGDNVMLGYATTASDLALGRSITELRTGDLARVNADGFYEVVGRRARFAKVFGKRIDLQQVEQCLAEHDIDATCFSVAAGQDSDSANERIVVAFEAQCVPHANDVVRDRTAAAAGIAGSAIQVLPLDELPRGSAGKVDLAALRECAIAADSHGRGTHDSDATVVLGAHALTNALVQEYATVLRRTDATEDSSFVSLRGDSMSYVELSARVERLLRALPSNWHIMPIRDLVEATGEDAHSKDAQGCGDSQEPARSQRRRWTQQVETNVLLRALAVFLVIGSHATLFDIRGGAHLLIAIAGFNFARFHLTYAPRLARVRGMLVSIRRIAIPSMAWMALAVLIDGQYSFANVFFVHNLMPPDAENAAWRYWFVEALVYVLIFSALILAVPALHRAEQRWPFGFVLAVLGIGLLLRYGVIDTATGPKAIYTPWLVLFVFALGWAIAKARTWQQRALVLMLVLATLPGYSENATRVVVVMAGLALLLLVPTIRVPVVVGKVVALVAGASLFIYLTHWQIYPLFGEAKVLAFLASLSFGVGLWMLISNASRLIVAVNSHTSVWWWKMTTWLPTPPIPPSAGRSASKHWSWQPRS